MPFRTRSRNVTVVGGSAWHPSDPSGTLTNVVYSPYDQRIDDYIGKLKRPDGSLPTSDLDIETVERLPHTISRNQSGSAWNFQAREIYTSGEPGVTNYPSRASRQAANQILAMQVVASTHPFRSEYSVPVAIKELVDVTTMFKIACRSFAGYVGGSYLTYKFGWVAFYNDVRRLHKITTAIERRIREYNSLIEHGNLRRRIDLSNERWSSSNSGTYFHSAYSTTIWGPFKTEIQLKTWGSVRWGLMGDELLPVDDLSKINLAIQAVFDLGPIDAVTAWELIPFSWLVDYFVNVGDTLQSQQFRYQIQPYDICIMREWSARKTCTVTSKPVNVSVGGQGVFVRRIRSRDTVNLASRPSLTLGFVSENQWKVLLALVAKFVSK